MISKAETSKVTVQVYCHGNSSNNVSTRWGSVSFDNAGYGEVTLEKEDLPMLDQLGWLLPADRASLFGKKKAEPKPKSPMKMSKFKPKFRKAKKKTE